MPTVFFPPQMRDLTQGATELVVEGDNVRRVIAAVDEVFPGFGERVLHEGKIAPGLAVAVDNEVQPLGVLAKVAPASVVHFVAAIAGGSSGAGSEPPCR